MTGETAIAIARRVEQGADLQTLLLAAEAREVRKAVAWLYTPVPVPVRQALRRQETEALKAAAKQRFEDRVQYERVIRDPHASEEDKRLARMELVAMDLPDYEDFDAEDAQ